jgi:hypothetical protein
MASRLQREADAELLDHVGFVGEVEIGLHGAGSIHHRGTERADLVHVYELLFALAVNDVAEFELGVDENLVHGRERLRDGLEPLFEHLLVLRYIIQRPEVERCQVVRDVLARNLFRI